MELQGTENLLVKCLCKVWLNPQTSKKPSKLKSTWTVGERDPPISLTVSTVEAGTSWNTAEGLSPWQGPCIWSQATLQSWWHQVPFTNSPCNLLAPVSLLCWEPCPPLHLGWASQPVWGPTWQCPVAALASTQEESTGPTLGMPLVNPAKDKGIHHTPKPVTT